MKIDKEHKENKRRDTTGLSAKSKHARRPLNDFYTIMKEDVGRGGDCPPRFPLHVMGSFHHKCPAKATSVKKLKESVASRLTL